MPDPFIFPFEVKQCVPIRKLVLHFGVRTRVQLQRCSSGAGGLTHQAGYFSDYSRLRSYIRSRAQHFFIKRYYIPLLKGVGRMRAEAVSCRGNGLQPSLQIISTIFVRDER